jgi:hypothetical protein
VGGVYGAVADAQVVEVCDDRDHGRAEAGDHLGRLPAELGEVPSGDVPQNQPIRGVASFYSDQLHHAGMGKGAQQVGFLSEPAALGVGVRPLVGQPGGSVALHLHQLESSPNSLENQ